MSTLFATVPDLADFLRTTLEDDDGAAMAALLGATAAIQADTQQHLAFVEGDQVTLEAVADEDLWLPELPVVQVTAVTVDGAPLSAGQYSVKRDNGRLRRLPAGTDWGSGWPASQVTVTYDHGYEAIPERIRTVCLAAAGRQFGNPDGIVREQTATYAVTYASGSAGVGVGVTLTEAEQRLLDRYRVLAVG